MFNKIVEEVMNINPDWDQQWVEGAVIALYANLGFTAGQCADMAQYGRWGASLNDFEQWLETGDGSRLHSLFEHQRGNALMGPLRPENFFTRTDEEVIRGAKRLGMLVDELSDVATEWWDIEQSVLEGHRIR